MDYQRLLSDAGVSALRKGVSIFAGLLVIPIITRWIGEGSYGIWATLISFVALATTVFGMHLHGALIRYSGQDSQQVFADILSLTAIMGVASFLLVVLVTTGLDSALGLDFIPIELILPTGVLICGEIFFKTLLNYPRSQRRVKHFEALATIRKIVQTIVLVVVFWWTTDLLPALWGLTAVIVGLDIILLLVYRDEFFSLPALRNFPQYLRYGIPMIPKELSGSLLHHADKFLLLYFVGPVQTGVYAVAYSVTTIFQSLSSVFNGTLYPNVTAAWKDGNFDELSKFYTVFLRWYTIIAIPAVVGLSLLASPVLRFISTPGIASRGAILIPVLGIAFTLQGLEFSLSYPLSAAEETGRIAIITVTAVIANIALNLLLIPRMGVLGAAIATAVAFFIRTIWLYYYVDEHLSVELPIRGSIYSLISTAAMGGLLIAFPVNSSLWKLGLFPPVGLIVFSVVFVSVGGLRAEEREKIMAKLNQELKLVGQ